MSWPVRSKRFGLFQGNPVVGATIIGTVPAGKTWLLKEWSFFNSGAARNFWVGVRAAGGGVDVWVDFALGVPTNGITGNHDRHLVLNAGDSLTVFNSTNGPCHWSFSGAQLG